MGKLRWTCFPLSRLIGGFRRRPLFGRSLIVASVCVVYLFFVVSQVDFSQNRRAYKEKFRRLRGLDHAESNLRGMVDSPAPIPTRSNVVYITLRSKRLKPANIRASVRPKLRRKARRNAPGDAPFTRGVENITRTFPSWRIVDYGSALVNGSGSHRDSSVIRIYSRKPPPWLSPQDVRALRFLAESKVVRVKEVSEGESRSFLVFEGETRDGSPATDRTGICGGQCGLVRSPVDASEVFAFHLDRVLGMNRTSPAVSRRFNFLYDGRPCPVVAWEESLHSNDPAAGRSTVGVTWGEYQRSLKQRCWLKNTVPREESGCSTVHHHEWSKMALFDFMLQIHNRLDLGCCGFRPRQEDSCVDLEVGCKNQDQIPLGNIIHKRDDPRRLVFTQNLGYFDRNEDNLDFRLLEGIKDVPEEAVSVLRSRKLREKLLQSLFLDQTYWESQGGRKGIEKLIDVIERRAQVLLTYINAHGIRTVSMRN